MFRCRFGWGLNTFVDAFLCILVKKGHVHFMDIEKKAVATCLRFATSNTIRKQFYHYLLPNGYIERVSRGIYKITKKGEKLLEILE